MEDYDKIRKKLQYFLSQFEEIRNKYKTINDWKRFADELNNNLNLKGFYGGSKKDRKDKLESAIEIIDQAQKTKNRIALKDQNFIKDQMRIMSLLIGYEGTENLSNEVFDSNLKNTFLENKWLMYCFHISNDNRQLRKPEICQAVLSIDDKAIAHLKNLSTKDDYNGIDYRGDVKKIDNAKTLVFNLFNIDADSTIERNLHIKTSFQTINDEIQLGTYNTFDGELKYQGSVVLKKVDYSRTYEAKLLSYWNNKEEFMQLDYRIIEYLSLKSRNYYLSPTKKPDLDSLHSLFKNHSPFKQVEQRFIELQKPRIFIATQQSSIENNIEGNKEGKKFVENLHSQLKAIFSKTHEITFHSEDVAIQVGILNYMLRTRFFILFVSDVSKVSLSSLQLGWAIAFCKKILLIHKRGLISQRLESFIAQGKIEGVKKVITIETILYDDVEKEKSFIISEIKDYIRDGTL